MSLSKDNKIRLKQLATEILRRVATAREGNRDSFYWDCDRDNIGAPEGVCYDDWIEEAENALLKQIELS